MWLGLLLFIWPEMFRHGNPKLRGPNCIDLVSKSWKDQNPPYERILGWAGAHRGLYLKLMVTGDWHAVEAGINSPNKGHKTMYYCPWDVWVLNLILSKSTVPWFWNISLTPGLCPKLSSLVCPLWSVSGQTGCSSCLGYTSWANIGWGGGVFSSGIPVCASPAGLIFSWGWTSPAGGHTLVCMDTWEQAVLIALFTAAQPPVCRDIRFP